MSFCVRGWWPCHRWPTCSPKSRTVVPVGREFSTCHHHASMATAAVHLLTHYFNGTNETLRHLYALCLTRELDGRMRHNRGYNSHLGWTDVRRRARPAFGPCSLNHSTQVQGIPQPAFRESLNRTNR